MNYSRSYMILLNDKLSNIAHDYKLAAEYLQILKVTSDEPAIINSSTDKDDLIIYALNGLGLKFMTLSVIIQAYKNAFQPSEHGAIFFSPSHDLFSDRNRRSRHDRNLHHSELGSRDRQRRVRSHRLPPTSSSRKRPVVCDSS